MVNIVWQDLALSSDTGSMSDDPDGTTNTKDATRDMTGDSGFNEGSAWAESKAHPPPEVLLDQLPDETTNLTEDQTVLNPIIETAEPAMSAPPTVEPGTSAGILSQVEVE